MKTNAVRSLENAGIAFETKVYESDPDELDAISVAAKTCTKRDSVFKTLVARGDKTGIAVFCIPGPVNLDLKKAASVSGNKRVELIRPDNLLPLTGYVRGGCSPIGMKKQYPTYIDETAQLFERIYVSAGILGAQLFIKPCDLQGFIGAFYSDLI